MQIQKFFVIQCRAAFILTYIIKTRKKGKSFHSITPVTANRDSLKAGIRPGSYESNVLDLCFSAYCPVRRNSYRQRVSCHSDELVAKDNV
jgi:hypothetical protein